MYDELVKRLRTAKVTVFKAEDVTLLNKAADAIEELSRDLDSMNEANIALYGALPKWIPVTERLPKYGERVLVFGGVTMYVAYYDKNRYGGYSWHKLNSKNHYCNPTHWMPLPSTEGLK